MESQIDIGTATHRAFEGAYRAELGIRGFLFDSQTTVDDLRRQMEELEVSVSPARRTETHADTVDTEYRDMGDMERRFYGNSIHEHLRVSDREVPPRLVEHILDLVEQIARDEGRSVASVMMQLNVLNDACLVPSAGPGITAGPGL